MPIPKENSSPQTRTGTTIIVPFYFSLLLEEWGIAYSAKLIPAPLEPLSINSSRIRLQQKALLKEALLCVIANSTERAVL